MASVRGTKPAEANGNGRNGKGPHLAPGDLRAFERRVYSQFGEDGIIEEILRRVGVKGRYFVECGVGLGKDGNCARLARDEGWQGLFVETDPEQMGELTRCLGNLPGVRCLRADVTPQTIEGLLSASGVPRDLDVLSIDLDGNDYWVWAAIEQWRPRVVVIEYNASHPPARRWVMKEDPGYRWNGTSYFGASLASLATLARRKGYTLVGTTSLGVNAFFVADELAAERFLDPAVHYHYSPPGYGPYQGGHPPGDGPYVEV
jgi:hypothetical protein